MHSRYYIENVLLPDYEMLMALETEDSDEFNSLLSNYNFFKNLLEEDLTAVADATAKSKVFRNFGLDDDNDYNSTAITFDSNADFTYSTTSSQTVTKTTTVDVEISFDLSYSSAFRYNGNGLAYTNQISTSNAVSNSTTGEEETGQTNIFVLGDDDPGDGFSFEVFVLRNM